MTKEEFNQLARTYTLIPVSRNLCSDLETPVSAFWKLRRGPWNFLFESVEGGETWARYTFMGTEPYAVHVARGNEITTHRPAAPDVCQQVVDPLDFITNIHADQRVYADEDLPRFVGGLVGAISYDAVRLIENLPEHTVAEAAVPDLVFMETRLLLVWDNLKHRATLVYLARLGDGEDVKTTWARAQTTLDEAQLRLEGPLPPLPCTEHREPGSVTPNISDAVFGDMVESVREYILQGDLIQAVVSRRFTQADEDLHPFLVYRTLRQLNPSPYLLFVELDETTLVASSPELLVRMTDGLVETRPIAGTRPRGTTLKTDEAMAEELQSDPKERAEHVMLLDLGRNDIGRIAKTGSVRVTENMEIERYSHVMHMVSHVTGDARDDVTRADVIRAVFPAGTLSGAPKIRAMEIIDELEPTRRGFYGGAIGFLGVDGSMDLCIAIRMLVAQRGQFDVQAGAGIVVDSNPEMEARETTNKAMSVLKAIDLARQQFHRIDHS